MDKAQIKRVLSYLRRLMRRNPPAPPRDPFAWKPVPIRPRPKRPSSAIAVAEPDDE